EYLTDALPMESRRLLVERGAYLHEAFRSHPGFDLTAPVAEMLCPYGRLAKASPESYVYVLLQRVAAPVWAALDAIKRVRVGEMARSEFPPLPGQLRAIAWHVARPYWVEGLTIARVLAARPPRGVETVERRREVAARILSELNLAGFAGVNGVSSK